MEQKEQTRNKKIVYLSANTNVSNIVFTNGLTDKNAFDHFDREMVTLRELEEDDMIWEE